MGIAVTATVANRMAVARAGADRIAGAGAGADDVHRAGSGNEQGARLVVLEDERMAAGVETNAVARGRDASARRSGHLETNDGNRRRRTPLGRGDRGQGQSGKLGREFRDRGRVLRVGLERAGRTRHRAKGAADTMAETWRHAGTAGSKRAAYPEAEADRAATAGRETDDIAAPAAAARAEPPTPS